MPVLEPAERPFDEVRHVGVVITKVGGTQLHSGFLYKPEEEGARILHLAFHHDLRDQPAPSHYRWAQLGLDDVNLRIFLHFLHRVAERQPLIPYGFNADGTAIDPDTGDLIAPPAGHGLTCATFIIAALKAQGHDLVDKGSWELRPEDAAWVESILDLMVGHAPPEHIEAVRNCPIAARFRPDEVVGSGGADASTWPIAFGEARALADQILIDLG